MTRGPVTCVLYQPVNYVIVCSVATIYKFNREEENKIFRVERQKERVGRVTGAIA